MQQFFEETSFGDLLRATRQQIVLVRPQGGSDQVNARLDQALASLARAVQIAPFKEEVHTLYAEQGAERKRQAAAASGAVKARTKEWVKPLLEVARSLRAVARNLKGQARKSDTRIMESLRSQINKLEDHPLYFNELSGITAGIRDLLGENVDMYALAERTLGAGIEIQDLALRLRSDSELTAPMAEIRTLERMDNGVLQEFTEYETLLTAIEETATDLQKTLGNHSKLKTIRKRVAGLLTDLHYRGLFVRTIPRVTAGQRLFQAGFGINFVFWLFAFAALLGGGFLAGLRPILDLAGGLWTKVLLGQEALVVIVIISMTLATIMSIVALLWQRPVKPRAYLYGRGPKAVWRFAGWITLRPDWVRMVIQALLATLGADLGLQWLATVVRNKVYKAWYPLADPIAATGVLNGFQALLALITYLLQVLGLSQSSAGLVDMFVVPMEVYEHIQTVNEQDQAATSNESRASAISSTIIKFSVLGGIVVCASTFLTIYFSFWLGVAGNALHEPAWQAGLAHLFDSIGNALSGFTIGGFGQIVSYSRQNGRGPFTKYMKNGVETTDAIPFFVAVVVPLAISTLLIGVVAGTVAAAAQTNLEHTGNTLLAELSYYLIRETINQSGTLVVTYLNRLVSRRSVAGTVQRALNLALAMEQE